MPFKYNQSRQHHVRAHTRHAQDWKHYNGPLKKRGDITIWLSQDVINEWYMKDRTYDGNGTPNLYSDMPILTVHEIRQVFKLPLRQSERLVNSLFKLMNIGLQSPSYSVLSKLNRPFYRKAHYNLKNITPVAIGSSGLKCFGHEEQHLEKYKIIEERGYKKLHWVVDNFHIIQCSNLRTATRKAKVL